MASNPYIKLRFGRIANWLQNRSPFVAAWPTFHSLLDGSVRYYGHYLLHEDVVEWRDVPKSEYDIDVPNIRAAFTHSHDYARRQGFEHGFPNFHQVNDGTGFVQGTYLIVPGTGEWRDVPSLELGLGSNPSLLDMDLWFARAADYAFRNGFEAGMPNGHAADYGQGVVCGVLLFPFGQNVQFVDVPGTELNLNDSGGVNPFAGLQPAPGPDTEVPQEPTAAPATSGTIVVTLSREIGSYGPDAGYRVGTAPNPAVWQGRNAKVTGVRNRHDKDIWLSHGAVSQVQVQAPAGWAAVGPTQHAFDGMDVEGDWRAETTWMGIPPSTIAFEIDWAV